MVDLRPATAVEAASILRGIAPDPMKGTWTRDAAGDAIVVCPMRCEGKVFKIAAAMIDAEGTVLTSPVRCPNCRSEMLELRLLGWGTIPYAPG